MAIRDWALLGVGLVLAGLGLGAFLLGGGEEPPAQETAAVVRPTGIESIVLEPDPVEIAGISDAIARVLESNGSAGMADRADLGLSAPVVRVLQENGVVLTVTVERDGDPNAVQVAR